RRYRNSTLPVDPADGGGKIDMKRSWNWSLWIGFLFALAGFLSYTFFAQFPVTRDFPWANLLLFAAGGIFLVLGLFRAFGKAQVYRGKVFGPILATLGILMFGFFSYVFFYQLRQVPPSTGAPRVGQKAPDFTLLDQNDKPVSLADLLSAPASSASTGRANAVLVIFYRGFW
ncbi:MAG: hypothetical protein DMF37_11060, partial [Verrucomicrobia bacterium]